MRSFPDVLTHTTGLCFPLGETDANEAVKSISTLFRSKILFPVASKAESTALIGSPAAFSLGGCGNAVYSDSRSLTRIKSFLADTETSCDIIEKAKVGGALYSEEIMHSIMPPADGGVEDNTDYDELLPSAIDVALETGTVSVSVLQRRLKLGYSRAAQLVDQMEEKGVIKPLDGSRLSGNKNPEIKEIINVATEVPYVETKHGKKHKRRILDVLLKR